MSSAGEVVTDAGQPETPKRRPLWLVLPLIFFIALAVLFYFRLYAGDPSRLPSALINKHVPEFTLPPITGKEGGLASTDLDKGVHLVNVWASWCVPCRMEHEALLELSRDKRFDLVGINYKDKAADALQFMGELGDPYAKLGADRAGRVAIDWGVYGVPETFLVRDGIITYKFIGPITNEGLKNDLMPAIEKALKGEALPAPVSSSQAPAKRGAGSAASG